MCKPLYIESILFPSVVTSNELNWQVFESKIKVVAEISLGPFLELSYLIRLQSSAFFAIVESLGGKLWLQTVVFVPPPPKKICHCQKKTFFAKKISKPKNGDVKSKPKFLIGCAFFEKRKKTHLVLEKLPLKAAAVELCQFPLTQGLLLTDIFLSPLCHLWIRESSWGPQVAQVVSYPVSQKYN